MSIYVSFTGSNQSNKGTLSITLQPYADSQPWVLEAKSGNVFTVTGSRSGYLGEMTVDVPFVHDDGTFTITSGAEQFEIGDAFSFTVRGAVAPRYVKKNNDGSVVNYPGGPAADTFGEGTWLTTRRMFENLPRVVDDEISFGDMLDHFRNVIKSQDGFEGSSFGVNNFRKLVPNLGFGGTVRDYSSNFQLLASNMMQADMSPLTIISFAEAEYTRAISSVDQFIANDLAQFIASSNALTKSSLPPANALDADDATVKIVVDHFEQLRRDNQALKEIYADSTAPIACWPITLPFIGLAPAVQPKVSFDIELGFPVIVHHDGHVSPIASPNDPFDRNLAITIVERSDGTKTQGIISLNAPARPYARELWYDSAASMLKVFDVTFDTEEAPVGSANAIWYKRSTQTVYEWDITGEQWFVSSTPVAALWQQVDIALIRNNMVFALETRLFDAVHPSTILKYDLSTFASEVDSEIELAKYAVEYGFDMYAPNYVASDAFTWNYSQATIPGASAARWFDIYEQYFDQPGTSLFTRAPNLEPWRLLNYETKAAANVGLSIDWDALYADTTNTRLWNNAMWAFIIAQRPSLKLCVDTATDELLPPYVSSTEASSVNALLTAIPAGVSEGYLFGQNGPTETVWKKSAAYLYGMARVAFKKHPMEFLDKTWGFTYLSNMPGGIRLERNTCAPLAPAKFLLHGERLHNVHERVIRVNSGVNVIAPGDVVKFKCSHVEDDLTYFNAYVNGQLIGSVTEALPFSFAVGGTSFAGAVIRDLGIPYSLGDEWTFTATTAVFVPSTTQKFLGFGQTFTNLLRFNYIATDMSEAVSAYRGWEPRLVHRVGALIRGDSLRIAAATVENLPPTAFDLVLKRSTNRDSKWISGVRVQLVQQGTAVLNKFGNEIPLADGSDWVFRVEVYNPKHPTAEYYEFDTNAEFLTFNALDKTATPLAFKHFTEITDLVSSALPLTITGVQNVVNFLYGYSDRLSDLGWTVNAGERIITDALTGRNLDWQLEIEKFVDAVYRGMMTGTGHVLNPFMHGLWLKTPLGLMARYSDKTFIDADSTQAAYDVTGAVIPVQDLQIIRTDEHAVTYSDTPIFSAHAFIDEFEHVIMFNNYVSDEHDSKTLYNPFLGLRIRTADVAYVRQEQIDRKPNFNGFMLVGNDVKRNITSSIDAVANYYDAHKTFNEPSTASHALSLLGWNKKSYFENLGSSDATQFNFWRGLIQAKGTNMTIDAFANYKKFDDAGVDEYWAYKLASYGDNRQREYPEMKIEVTDSLQNFTQLQFFDANDTAYTELPLFTQIETGDDARWFSIDDLGKGLSFKSDYAEEILPSLDVGYYALPTIMHSGDGADPIVMLRSTTADGIVLDEATTAASMVNSNIVKISEGRAAATIPDGQLFYMEEQQILVDHEVGVLESDGAVDFRFAQNLSKLSPDGNFYLDSNGVITQTAVGKRSAPQTEDSLFSTTTIQRLAMKYFRVEDLSVSASAALVSYGNAAQFDFTARSEDDEFTISFDTVDSFNHSNLKYATKKDYRSIIWSFDVELFNSPALNQPNGLTIVVEGKNNVGNPVTYEIPAHLYSDNPSSTSAHISVNFGTVKTGPLLDQPTYMGDVDKISLRVRPSSYTGLSDALPNNAPGGMRLSNCVVTGTDLSLSVKKIRTSNARGISTNYDELWTRTPELIIESIERLGHEGTLVHNVGAAIFPERVWNGSSFKIVATGSNTAPVINLAARKWHESFAHLADQKAISLILSVSGDMYAPLAISAWAQRTWVGDLAVDSNNMNKISFSHTAGIAWMSRAMLEFAALASNGSQIPQVQIDAEGWFITDADLPCVYDAEAKSMFIAETGFNAPNINLAHDAEQTATPHPQWRDFLQREFGKALQEIRDGVLAIIPAVAIGIQIDYAKAHDGGVTSIINLPSPYLTYPNFNFFQLKMDKWLTPPDFTKLDIGFNYPASIWYPKDFTFFNAGPIGPNNSLGWTHMMGVLQYSEAKSISKWIISGFTEIIRDDIVLMEGGVINDIAFPALRSFFVGGDYVQTYPHGANEFDLWPNAFTYSVQAESAIGVWSASSIFSVVLESLTGQHANNFATYISIIKPTKYEYVVKGRVWREQTKQAPVKLFNYQERALVKDIGLWHPAIGLHAYEALDVVNTISGNDPALYNSTVKVVNNPNYALVKPWSKREVGRVWWNTANLGYVPYYDNLIFPDRNERHARWGSLADWASLDLYEWVESDVPPEEYDALASAEEGASEIPASIRKSGKAAMKRYYASTRIISARPIAWSYTPSGNALAHPAFGSPVNQKAMIASGAIFIDATRTEEAGLTEGRHFSGWKLNKPFGEAVIDAGIVYDLGNSTTLSAPFAIPSGLIDDIDIVVIPDGRLGEFIGKISISSRLEQLDSSVYLQKLRMSDDFGNFEDITINDWLPESEDDRAFDFVDFGIRIKITRADSTVTYAAIDIVTDILTSWSDVYIREGARFTEILALPDDTFVNDENDPDFGSYDFGWRAWTIPTQEQLDQDLVYPRNAWLPYLGDKIITDATPAVISEMKAGGVILKSGVGVNRFSSTWTNWVEVEDIRINKLSDGTSPVLIGREEFLNEEELDTNRISIFVDGIQMSPKLYIVGGEEGAEVIQLINTPPEGSSILFIYRAKQLTDADLAFDPAVEDDPSIQIQYRATYQHTKVDVRSEAGAIIGAKYYFWVQDSTVVRPDKNMSLIEAKGVLRNGPSQYMMFERIDTRTNEFDSCVIAGLNRFVKNNGTYKLRFTLDETLRDNPEELKLKNVHTEWTLIKKSQNSKIPAQLWNQLTDAAAGSDAGGNPLPSPARVDYDARHGTNTSYGFEQGQILAATDLVRSTIKNTILNTSLEIRINGAVFPDRITALNPDDAEEWFEDAESARATMNLIWASARAKQINEVFFAVLEDALANNYEMTDIFKTSMISIYSTTLVTQQNQSELQDGIF